MLPAMEAVQAAKEQGLAASEALDIGLRRAFWGESRCVSMRHVILEVASETDGLDLARLAEALDSGRARRAIFDDWEIAKTDAVQGSRTSSWPTAPTPRTRAWRSTGTRAPMGSGYRPS